jgi:hypothetical protein
MNETLAYATHSVLIGAGATATMDLWGLFAARFLGFQPPNYAMVGRWIGHMPHGRFKHDRIAEAAPIPNERIIGWTAHYAIGISFAGFLLSIWGLEWAQYPTLLPAMATGLMTLLAPFFLMQPGMGAGIASSRLPKPNPARGKSLLTHTIFGLGLYLSAWALC